GWSHMAADGRCAMRRWLLALFLALTAPPVAEPIDPEDVTVIDGDTIAVYHMQPNVRLVGFNAPESSNALCEAERQLGVRATQRLQHHDERHVDGMASAVRFAMPVGSSWPTTATTRGPCSITSGTSQVHRNGARPVQGLLDGLTVANPVTATGVLGWSGALGALHVTC